MDEEWIVLYEGTIDDRSFVLSKYIEGNLKVTTTQLNYEIIPAIRNEGSIMTGLVFNAGSTIGIEGSDAQDLAIALRENGFSESAVDFILTKIV